MALKSAPAVAAAPAATPAPAAPVAGAPKIERFNVAPVDKLDPGVDLKFTLAGTPGARAIVGMKARSDQAQSRDLQLVLFQQK